MTGFNVSIATAIKRFNNHINFLQPLVEAISNSLEANAQNISIIFYTDKIQNLIDDRIKKIESYSIEDDGDGFTDTNISSFLTYMSEHKVDIGCKGVGRITWLKVFSYVEVESIAQNKKIYFKFDENFSDDDITETVCHSDKNKTIIKFHGVKKQFYDSGKIDLRIDSNLQKIKDFIEESLLVKLSLLKSQGVNFNITIKTDDSDESLSITNTSLTSLCENSFYIPDGNDNKIKFLIHYSFFDAHGKQKNTAFYCANGRTVEKLPKKIVFSALPSGKSSIILVSSSFFDDHINNERNQFNIPQTENRIDCPISWEKINFYLQLELDSILLQNFPNLEEDNQKNISELIDEFPYLAKYIREDNSKIKTKDKILANSKKRYEQDKEAASRKFKKLLNENIIDSDEFIKSIANISEVSARELAEYIVYRQQIILALHRLNTENEKSEKRLHNLFMKMGTESSKENRQIYDNNLWLFDDKFMTYVYAASDIAISKYENALDKMNIFGLKRPDLSVFFSGNDPDQGCDALVVEFKACDASLDEKSKAFWEIIRNAQAIRQSIPNIDRIWCYTVTKFDDAFRSNIITQDFKPLFSNGDSNEIYYRYYSSTNAHCYYISLDALISDATARNNILLDIIKSR